MGRGVKLGGGMGIVVVIAALFLGQDPGQILGMLGGGQTTAPAPRKPRWWGALPDTQGVRQPRSWSHPIWPCSMSSQRGFAT